MVIAQTEWDTNVAPLACSSTVPAELELAAKVVELQPLRVVTTGELIVNPGITIVIVSPGSKAALSAKESVTDEVADVTGFATVIPERITAGVTAVICVEDGIAIVDMSVADAKFTSTVLLLASAL